MSLAPLGGFGVDDVIALNERIRDAAEGCDTMAEAAQAIVDDVHSTLVLDDGTSHACALVRIYTSLRGNRLPADVLVEAERDRRYLTLLGTAGLEDAWNDRRRSEEHRAIALDRADVLAVQAPMIGGGSPIGRGLRRRPVTFKVLPTA